MKLTVPDPALVLLVGPSGAGNSTFALAAAAALDRSIADRLNDIRPLEEWLGRSLETVP